MNAHSAHRLGTIGNVPTLPVSAGKSGRLKVPRVIALTYFMEIGETEGPAGHCVNLFHSACKHDMAERRSICL
jgi:hypothetical protein